MKFVNEPITVDGCSDVPRHFRWGSRTYRTRKLLDYWILQTRWWGREEKRIYFRLETDHGAMEVYRAFVFEAPPDFAASTSSGADTAAGAGARGDHSREDSWRAVPPFVEGDTHTREVRRTDFPYRPDADLHRRSTFVQAKQSHWMLSKILD